VVGDVDLAADDRLDPLLAGLAVELDRPRERAVVGERDRRHLELGRPRGERWYPARAVEDRVLGVDVEVDERGFEHGEVESSPAPGGRLQPPNGNVSWTPQRSGSNSSKSDASFTSQCTGRSG